MRTLSCPYCYYPIKDGELWFLCTGRGSPGYAGCEPRPDAARAAATGFNEPTRPAFPPPARWGRAARRAPCPQCYGLTGIRACPTCHTPLSTGFGDSNSPLIALVGATGTGKTVYLTVLAHELRSNLRRRFDADVRLTGDGQGGVRSSLQWLEGNVERMFTHRNLGPLTNPAPAGRRAPLVFEWRQASRRFARGVTFRSSFLSFYDTAGEDLTSQDRAHDQAYIGAANALIVLLDPFMLPQARNRIQLPETAIKSKEATIDVLARVTEHLRASRGVPSETRIRVPLAVAFAKMDAFFHLLGPDHPLRQSPPSLPFYNEPLGASTHEHVRGLLYEWGADDIDAHLNANYTTFRYFGVSALGAEPDYETLTVEEGGVQPHRVDEPLVWLLSHFNVIPRGRPR